jgi:hypothetical protein
MTVHLIARNARPWTGWTRNPDGTWTAPPEQEEQA